MRMKPHLSKPFSLALALLFVAPGAPRAQARQQSSPRQPPPPPAQSQPPTPQPTPQGATAAQQEEVIQVTTELVQTGVAVFDKGGRFVEGLRREQFEVLVDGKPRPVDFFERVIAGTPRERSQAAAARGGRSSSPPPREEAVAAATATTDAGRTVFFLVDDLHLSAENVGQARKTILRFVESAMGQNDRAAVAAVSGRVGFLQQLTDHKGVLRAAVGRIVPRPREASAISRPYISAYQAIAVEENNERGVLEYLVGEFRREDPDVPPQMAEQIIRTRTRGIVQEAEQTNRLTLASLEGLMRSAAEVPGRKVIFFLSDGFIPLSRNPDERARMQRVTDAAARTGSVIYTVHTRGLATDPNLDASRSIIPDPFGISGANSSGTGELMATLEPLRTLAEETGGRAIVNTNALDAGITRSLEETSRYYLLAWRPEGAEAGTAGAFRRVEVRVAGRPDLSVRLHKGFISGRVGPAPGGDKSAAAAAPVGQPSAQPSGRPSKTPQGELRAAVSAVYPKSELPVFLSASFLDEPGRGVVVTVSVRVQSDTLSFNAAGGKRAAAVDLACFVFDAEGKQAGGGQDRLDVSAPAAADAPVPQRNIIYNYQTTLKPGLYQVRAAARDAGGGRVGVATEWIEIPDLKQNRLALGSLLVAAVEGEAKAGAGAKTAEAVRLAVGEAFPRGSRLRFYTNVYNAARVAGGPDVSVQVKVLHRDRVIFDTGPQKLAADGAGDPSRLPYAAEVNFGAMPPGRYLLQLIATDNTAKQSAAQFSRFEIR